MNNDLNLQDVSIQALLGNIQEYLKQKNNSTSSVIEDKLTTIDKEDLQAALIQLITGKNIDDKSKIVGKAEYIDKNIKSANKDRLQ